MNVGPLKVVFDTNILVSGHFWKGPPYRCMLAVEAGLATLVLSDPIVTEFSEKLTGKFRVRLEVTVPNGEVRTAVTGRNWEGAGVRPDVRVTGSDALRVGHIRALRDLLKQAPSGPWHDTLKRHLDALEHQDRR